MDDPTHNLSKFLFHPIDDRWIGVAKIDREKNLPWHYIWRSGFHLNQPNGSYRMRRVGLRNRANVINNVRGTDERILTARHGCCSRMSVLTSHRNLIPTHRLHTSHHTNVFALIF